MTFQRKVNRAYTTGFPGDVIMDGPLRARPGIIVSPTVGTDPAASTNRVSRVFGYVSDAPDTGIGTDITHATDAKLVEVGGENFFGVLFHPKHYTLFGTSDGPLAASLDLPQYSPGEFAHMAFIVAEIFNETTAAKTSTFGDKLAYVPKTISAADNPQALPYGALVSYTGDTPPTGMLAVPLGQVVNTVSIPASSAGEPVSTWTKIQLTL